MPQAVRDPGTGQQEIVGGTGLKTLSQTFAKTAFTDVTTTGTIDFGVALPKGAVVLGWSAVAPIAWSGDTTATIQVGESGALGRFSTTTTGSIFAAGAVSSFTVAATANCVAAVTPRVTVTSTADFTNVNVLATVTVTIYYIDSQNP